ncbi:MAG: vWA domain-containing protein [Gemmataceae bacterium]
MIVRALLIVLTLALGAVPGPAAPTPAEKKPRVEVVFCLDTTGSMGGLIEGAKSKIWSICNQIAGGKPSPDLKVGLVAYRDRGDEYVTRVVELTDDLDAIHTQLKKFQAGGGGDGPESVNQAIDDAVNKIKWSTEKRTLRIIFLVGDAPPHMDYKDDVKYPDTCKKAVEKGILINTIQCGTDAECARVWRDVAVKSEGSYAAIPQSGGVVAIRTPYDADLAKLNAELADTTLAYGTMAKRRDADAKVAEAKALPAGAAADRAGFGAKAGKGAVKGDLIDDLRERKVDLNRVKDEELPEALRRLKTPKERDDYVKTVEKKRSDIQKKAAELDKKRGTFIAEEIKKTRGKGGDSFDSNVLEMLRKQAKKFEIDY